MGGGQPNQGMPTMPSPQMGMQPSNAASHVMMAQPSKPQIMPATSDNVNQGDNGGAVPQGMPAMPPVQGGGVPVKPNFIPPVS